MKKSASVQFKTQIGLLSHLPGMHYVEIPARIIKTLGSFKMRLVCTINKKLSFQCGLMALGAGRGYISITKKRMKELGVSEGDRVSVELRPDKSEFGMTVPEELVEVFAQDPQGKKRFDGLTPGKQRYIIHYVASVKSSDKRIERALLLIGNLKKLPLGRETFRGMLGLGER